MAGYLSDLESEVMAEWRKKSQNVLYQTDPEAWLWDVLGRRWWSKQSEIAQSFVHNTFTLVKSANGVGKTMLAADLVGWFANVFPAPETSVLVSAPVRAQIDEMMFRYLRELYSLSERREKKLRGDITRWPKWTTKDPYDIDLVVPKRPADSNLLSSFQGVHNTHVAVVLDEAGGLQEDFYMGANAVTTNEHAAILGIGNPDQLNTAFHQRFASEGTENDKYRDWHRYTIGVNDTPNFTGEIIYPGDPKRDAEVKSKLVQVSWAEMMRRSARPAVVAAKVDGNFPDSDDNTFFDQPTINMAFNTEVMPSVTAERWLGVDLAYQGEDKCAAYMNWAGKIRRVDEWDRFDGTEHIESARRIHNLAVAGGCTEVRVDAAGTGSGVFSNLKTLDEFRNRPYFLLGVLGANASPDKNRWLNARAWHYDQFREGMASGKIDLDFTDDTELRDELTMQTAGYTLRNQLKITSKDDMRKAGIHSPDHLDAAIYSYIDSTPVLGAGNYNVGDTIVIDPFEMLSISAVGMPI